MQAVGPRHVDGEGRGRAVRTPPAPPAEPESPHGGVFPAEDQRAETRRGGSRAPNLTENQIYDTDICMKTTLDIDDRVLREAKKRAADEGSTLTHLIETALRQYLNPPESSRRAFKLRLLTKRGRLIPGVNLDDRDSLYERMEGRD